MGIFGGGYEKPGKGVDKNAPKKRGFFLFWELVFRKFTKLLGANCLLTLTSIIWLAFLYIVAPVHSESLQGMARSVSESTGLDAQETIDSLLFMFRAMFTVGIFTLWGSGPSSAAYAYVTRCFTKEIPVWVASDGWDKFKENFKQGIIVVFIDAAVLLLGMNAIFFYYGFYISTQSFMWLLLCYIVCLVLFVYTLMHFYIYQLMVTFEYKLKELYKNALLLALGKLPMSLLLLLIGGGISIGLFFVANPMVALLFLLIAGPCVTRYPMEFYTTRVLEKTIAANQKKTTGKITYLEEDE